MDKAMAMVNHNQFKRKSRKLMNELESLINTIPQKGNSSEECQKVSIMIAFNNLDSYLNGTCPQDFMI